jgi:hypothetical protein
MVSMNCKGFILSEDVSKSLEEIDLNVSFSNSDTEFKYVSDSSGSKNKTFTENK